MTTEEKKTALKAGRPLVFDNEPVSDSNASNLQDWRTVDAAWLMQLCDADSRTLRTPIKIVNAVITGRLDLSYVQVESDFQIQESEFVDDADFSFAEFFKRADFSGSKFSSKAAFRAVHAHADLVFFISQFEQSCNFQDLCVDQVLSADGAVFHSPNFERLVVSKNAFFRSALVEGNWKSTQFFGRARFKAARFEYTAEFDGAEFHGYADFEGIHVRGYSMIRTDPQNKPVEFHADASFTGARFDAVADFTGAQFHGAVCFDHVVIGNSAFFSPYRVGRLLPVLFRGRASFNAIQIANNLELDAAVFHAEALFDNASIGGTAFLRGARDLKRTRRIRFLGRTSFRAMHVGRVAFFHGSTFKSGALFSGMGIGGDLEFGPTENGELPAALFGDLADFSGVHVGGRANFRRCRFRSNVLFERAEIHGPLLCERSTFAGDVSFRDAKASTIQFREEMTQASLESYPPQFQARVDFIGCAYERIAVAWEPLVKSFFPQSRLPYVLLERVIRRLGEDRMADDIYWHQKSWESGELWRRSRERWDELPRAILSSLNRHILNYGVRPYRLFVLSCLFIFLGTLVFMAPYAVVSRDLIAGSNSPVTLTGTQAFGFSVNQFLPVPIPSGSKWVPSEYPVPIFQKLYVPIPIPFSVLASIQRLLGLVLVPAGIAALTGLLRRVNKPA